MDKATRSLIERATQRARTLCEDDFAEQLEGRFDILRDGSIAENAGKHLSPREIFRRDKIVAAIEHKRAAGLGAAVAVGDYVRDAAFTTLNRLVALKMLEARELLQECVSKGEQSAGYREFHGMAPELALLAESAGYRLYLESLFDELSTEVKVLFDRRDVASVLWPRRATFEALLMELNAPALEVVWAEDETLGWVFQFFNSGEERKKMRDESQAPRTSRELAVRNQFFTPRYVVEFLTDNTLGRIWYEMRSSESVLTNRCAYLVRKPGEAFAERAKKDPRDLKVLDPACGSGHFLLYAFDLLAVIYEEAYGDAESPRSEVTGRTLAADYPELDDLRGAMPGLILGHNLHGVDIDARCAQIAQLALWMRAQRAYRDFGIARAERPAIRRSNLVTAEPLVADEATAAEFVKRLGDAELARVFTGLVDALKLAGDLGLLLRAETLVSQAPKRGETGTLFAPPEARIRATLAQFVSSAGAEGDTRRRLFAEDAAQGVGLLETAEKRFDVVLMNPPFGEPVGRSRQHHKALCADAADSLAVSFISRGMELLAARGRLGAIADCSWQTKGDYAAFRRRMIDDRLIQQVLDLGWGVLDANVETSLGVFGIDEQSFSGWRCPPEGRADALKHWASSSTKTPYCLSDFAAMPNSILAYEMPKEEFAPYQKKAFVNTTVLRAVAGIKSCDSAADFRLWWEVSPAVQPLREETSEWRLLHNGSPYSPFHFPALFAVRATANFRELLGRGGALPGLAHYAESGCAYGKRTDRMYAYVRSAHEIFSQEGQALFPVGEASVWDVLALANPSLFQRHANYVAGQHKYHNYLNMVALAKSRDPAAALAAREAHLLLAELDLANELAGHFVAPGSCPEFDLANQPDERVRLARDRLSRVRVLHNLVNMSFALEDIDREPPQEVDYYSIFFGEPYGENLVRTVWISWAMGCAFGRWGSGAAHAALVDDPGASNDITSAILTHLPAAFADRDAVIGRLRGDFFQEHIARFSRSRRKAPIYWQLATPSGTYSVWIYLQAFNKDTLYQAQRYVDDKLVHEQRQLERMRSESGPNPNALARGQLDTQASFVGELRAMLEEVQRVAPIWNPNLDDGVLINFSPLHRLVPQNKPWQQELRTTWAALARGEYDWAHLAMHLWPERVVPRCATDRSLAIAHGLEEVFWLQGADKKWKPRAAPTRSVEELVRRRTSAAVKASLKSLDDAPVAGGAPKRKLKSARKGK